MKADDLLMLLLRLFIITFGLFIAYQIIRKLLGGSWNGQDIITALVMAHITLTVGALVTTTKSLTRISSDLRHLTRQFNSLATDFKSCRKSDCGRKRI